jgi:hypothetical protein
LIEANRQGQPALAFWVKMTQTLTSSKDKISEETMTTILLAGVLSFLLFLAIVLTLMRLDIARYAFTSDSYHDRPLPSRIKSVNDGPGSVRDRAP